VKTPEKEKVMAVRFVRNALFVAVALGLAGCATHSEPPGKTVKLAFIKHLTGDHSLHLHWPEHHHRTIIYEELIHSHVEKCVPTHQPDVRACSVYIRFKHKSLDHHGVIDMMKVGSKWHLLWN
jgi:hypothetical protein